MATIANDTQFIGISPTIDLTGKKSAILNAQTEPVTMADITSTVRPYNVFTALLTQSGGDDPLTIFSGTLIVGVSYLLVGTYAGDDFSNVGGPKIMVDFEYDGTYFVATGTTPNSWTQGTEISYNTGAPVATVLENTIGNIWFTYVGVGEYYVNSDGLFIESKTYFQNVVLSSEPSFLIVNISTANILELITGGNNNELFNTPIEIRVYE